MKTMEMKIPAQEKMSWHEVDAAETAGKLRVDLDKGLTASEAASRLQTHGPNELEEKGGKGKWAILWEQLTSTMVVILIIAGVLSAALGDFKDAIAIFTIVILNSLLGFGQEYKAEKAMAALKKMATPKVRVRRDDHVLEIPSRNIVPGDIILLEAGNVVPADARLIEIANLRVQEAALTGESEPVEKDPQAISGEKTALADRRNMVYLGTTVIYGRGEALVVGTGMKTELGHIANMISTAVEEPTPLQKRLDHLGKQMAWIALGIVAVVFVLGLFRGVDVRVMFMTAVSMAVAAIPEGLPAVVTIALALGAQRMLKRKALIRKLPAVETLGSVTVICSDKTGTLTQNVMTVTTLQVAGLKTEIENDFQPLNNSAISLLLTGSALCNDAVLEESSNEKSHAVGDPTESALLVAAARQGLEKDQLEAAMPRVSEVPFDSERKRMTTIHELHLESTDVSIENADWKKWSGGASYIAFTKGSVGGLLEIANRVWVDDRVEPINEAWCERITQANQELAKKGMRVLGLAFKPVDNLSGKGNGASAEIEKDLIFVGLTGMIDPARPEAKDAVQTCKTAGIRTVMITGDQALTARSIAAELEISTDGRVLTGRELETLSASDLQRAAKETSVFARVSPEHKLKLIQAFKDLGHNVAMTGDGVNDAPALKKADIGVAMGVTGTDVSKEAADMVLLDDNFATIVAAVEEGRVIYDNIRKFIKYLLTTNSAELLLMVLAPLFGMPLPLLPLQILWINLITDGPTSLTLAVEAPERNVMRRPPYSPNESVFGRGLARHAIWVGLLMTAVSVGTGLWYWKFGHQNWQTMVFTTMAFSQMGHVLAIRSERESLFTIGILSNKWLFVAVIATVFAQLAVVYAPFLQSIFKTMPLTGGDVMIALAAGLVLFSSVEIEKMFSRRHVS